MELLIIEDDAVIGKALRQGFTEAGHACVWAKDGERGLAQASTQQFDAIILDLMLPGKPGLEVLGELRTQGIQTPVILLTALGSVDERVTGLNAGADDYVVKPFALPELMARIEAVCRRTATRPPAVMQAGELTLDLATRRASRENREIDLTPTEFSLLELLMRYAGQVVTRKMLCEHLWESD
jgi:two-component system OmpR family response regulator/two-component system copper resistance phosphate regulon response regulator CusR